MKVIQSPANLKATVGALKKRGKRVGFVPTMGFLHEGHLSLVRESKKENPVTVVSIFVNPLQFGPREDLRNYPRDLVKDTSLLTKEKVDILFAPSVKDFYPEGFQTAVTVKELSRPLCGVSRPTHFTGVATVVLKLLNLVGPDVLYLGQKDFQQCRVLERMIEDLAVPVKVRRIRTKREPDGLAMSSRNTLLSSEERTQALVLRQALQSAEDRVRAGVREGKMIKQAMLRILGSASGGFTDYAEIVDAKSLGPVVKLKKGDRILAAVAVYFNNTRLIDNILIKV